MEMIAQTHNSGHYQIIKAIIELFYPNPSKDVFKFNSIISIGVLSDNIGRKVKIYENIDCMDLSGHESGIYYLHAKDSNVELFNLKLVKD